MVVRVRPKQIADPYSNGQVPAGWDKATETEIPGGWIAQSSTNRLVTATRAQLVESRSLYCDPSFDIAETDRIRDGGVTYEIDGLTAADTNPWTGWQPVREVPLSRVVG